MKKSILTNPLPTKKISTTPHEKRSSRYQDDNALLHNNYTSSSQQRTIKGNKNNTNMMYQDDISFYHDFSDDLFINSPVNTVQKTTSLTWCYSITPVHLKGLDIICKIFGRSRYTVKQWSKEGAPIVYDGISYISEYNALFGWLLDRYR